MKASPLQHWPNGPKHRDGRAVCDTCELYCERVGGTAGACAVTIIIAWLEDDIEVVRERRADLGERPITREIKVPKTCLWLNEGTAEDVAKARAYAVSDLNDRGGQVYTFSTDHPDPRGAAARSIVGRYSVSRRPGMPDVQDGSAV